MYPQHQSPDSLANGFCWFYGEPWGEGRIIFADRFGDVCRWSGAPDHEPELLSSHFAIVFWQKFWRRGWNGICFLSLYTYLTTFSCTLGLVLMIMAYSMFGNFRSIYSPFWSDVFNGFWGDRNWLMNVTFTLSVFFFGDGYRVMGKAYHHPLWHRSRDYSDNNFHVVCAWLMTAAFYLDTPPHASQAWFLRPTVCHVNHDITPCPTRDGVFSRLETGGLLALEGPGMVQVWHTTRNSTSHIIGCLLLRHRRKPMISYGQ